MINRATMNHQSRPDPQTALKMRLRELAAGRVRFGYRRLTVMLRRGGWPVNAKRIYRLYTADGWQSGRIADVEDWLAERVEFELSGDFLDGQ